MTAFVCLNLAELAPLTVHAQAILEMQVAAVNSGRRLHKVLFCLVCKHVCLYMVIEFAVPIYNSHINGSLSCLYLVTTCNDRCNGLRVLPCLRDQIRLKYIVALGHSGASTQT